MKDKDYVIHTSRRILYSLIQFYYIHEPSGGHLHIVLDDGNIEHCHIATCFWQCQAYKDYLGMLIATILLYYSEDELCDMYDDDWWGMRKRENHEKEN